MKMQQYANETLRENNLWIFKMLNFASIFYTFSQPHENCEETIKPRDAILIETATDVKQSRTT